MSNFTAKAWPGKKGTQVVSDQPHSEAAKATFPPTLLSRALDS